MPTTTTTMRRSLVSVLISLSVLSHVDIVQAAGKANTFEIVGNSGVSAQQMFLGVSSLSPSSQTDRKHMLISGIVGKQTANKVYILDKVQNNSLQINDHPAWATEYDLTTNEVRALDIVTNTFCAGGAVMGNGSWLNVGGNQAVQPGGVTSQSVNVSYTTPGGVYQDTDGGQSQRFITPCDDDSCAWSDDAYAISKMRWYPTLETLEDGSVIIIGGEEYGGFVNTAPGQYDQNVPTYEFVPPRGDPVTMQFLLDSIPANLYALTWLLPNGLLFVQGSWLTTLHNYTSNVETRLPNMTHAQRTYPGSAATAMLPLTPANNYEPTLLFCGGMDPERDDWDPTKWEIANTATSASCVSIQPTAASPQYKDEDDLPDPRGMGNFIILPDKRLFLVNGVQKGSAGYGFYDWAAGQSFAKDPITKPAYYDPSKPSGKRWDTNLPDSTIERVYHSSATLLPDGSVFIAGSSPSADVITEANNASYPFKTEYRTERFYPSYYDAGRPVPSGVPTSLSYGGASFDLTLPSSSLHSSGIDNVSVMVVRTGFSTHGINFGMKALELNHTFTQNSDNSATLHVSQMPPNSALFQPGPALFFVVVNGIPSIGQFITVGSGEIGTQPTSAASVLPRSTYKNGSSPTVSSTTTAGSAPSSTATVTGGASARAAPSGWTLTATTILLPLLIAMALAFSS